jgi:hypothetical protein
MGFSERPKRDRLVRIVAGFVVAGVTFAAAVGFPRPALADSFEAQLRDYTYTFASPGGAVGPWHVVKLDFDADLPQDHVLLRALDGERDDAAGHAHGEFLRLEDTHTFGRFGLTLGAGSGNGYQPRRSGTVEVLWRPTPAHVWLTAGYVGTTLTTATSQRIVALGANFAVDRFSGYMRYYRPDAVGFANVAPPSASFVAGYAFDRRLRLGAIVNFGGEVGGDRTASELPTSSGRYGLDTGETLEYFATQTIGFSALYEVANYRQAPAGVWARRQDVLSLGLVTRL